MTPLTNFLWKFHLQKSPIEISKKKPQNAKLAAAMVVSTNNRNYIKACKMLQVSTKMGRDLPSKPANTPRTPTSLWDRVVAAGAADGGGQQQGRG